MSNTPSNSDKKRVATSPLDSVDNKKTRTLSTDSTMSEPVAINLDDTSLQKIADVLRSTFEAQLGDMVATIVTNVLESIQSKLTALQTEKAALQDRVSELERRVELLEKQEEVSGQYSRRNCLRLSGIKETEDESMDVILKRLSTEIKAGVDLRDIDNMHRLGRPRSSSNEQVTGSSKHSATRPRDIIIKFTSYRARQMFLTRRSSASSSTRSLPRNVVKCFITPDFL